MGNREQLGRFIAIAPSIEFLLLNKKIKWSLNLTNGIGYVSKPFNLKTNHKNDLLGSNINMFVNFQTQCYLNINSRLKFTSGLSFSHLSNGAFALPNLGINIPGILIGFEYKIDQEFKQKKKPISFAKSANKFLLLSDFGFGIKEYTVDGVKNPIVSNSVDLWYAISKTSSIGIISDLFYNSALQRHFLKTNQGKTNSLQVIRHGIGLGYKLNLSRVDLYCQLGIYTYAKNNFQSFMFQKIGGYVWITQNLFASVNLKTHYAVADFFEFGLGYRLWGK